MVQRQTISQLKIYFLWCFQYKLFKYFFRCLLPHESRLTAQYELPKSDFEKYFMINGKSGEYSSCAYLGENGKAIECEEYVYDKTFYGITVRNEVYIKIVAYNPPLFLHKEKLLHFVLVESCL